MRSELGNDITIRLDANRAWIFDQAQEALLRLNEYNIEYVEEPLQEFDPERYDRLYDTTRVALALDESIAFAQSRINEIDSSFVPYLIVKPGACGGIGRALAFEQMSAARGFRTVFTSGLETSVGLTAGLHTAAAVSASLLPCGFSTAGLFADTEASRGVTLPAAGRIALPAAPGLGIAAPGFEP
jgi:O-succinylbenzoate synthase